MTHNSREALLASMRRTLMLMHQMGVPKELLLETLEVAAKELREELTREKGTRQ